MSVYGNFFGMIPNTLSECKMYGVEIDTISGGIARQLYQKNTIAIKGFEDVELPDSYFDVAIRQCSFSEILRFMIKDMIKINF